MTIPTRLRQRDILTAQLASCQRVDSSFGRGAAAGLRWLIAGGPGPLTGATGGPVDFGGIVRELAAAEAIIYGPPSTGRGSTPAAWGTPCCGPSVPRLAHPSRSRTAAGPAATIAAPSASADRRSPAWVPTARLGTGPRAGTPEAGERRDH
jgi:hypothetical protein